MATLAETVELALQHLLAGDLTYAQRLSLLVLQHDPANAECQHLLGVIAYQQGHYEESVLRIRQALGLNPIDGSYHTNLGLALEALGQLDQAIESHRHALRLRGDDSDAYYNLGTCLLRHKEFSEAETCLRQALAFDQILWKLMATSDSLSQSKASEKKRLPTIARHSD